jgi:hypothetical protein
MAHMWTRCPDGIANRHVSQIFSFLSAETVLDMNKAWPRLLRRIENGKISSSASERDLVVAARTWFCLYLFEHQ